MYLPLRFSKTKIFAGFKNSDNKILAIYFLKHPICEGDEQRNTNRDGNGCADTG